MKLYNIIYEATWAADADSNIAPQTKQFADLMDAVAKKLQLPSPVITSGLRGPERQAKAMFNIWRKDGSEYLVTLYGKLCASCSDNAGDIAKKLADTWDENKGMIPKALILPGSKKANKLIELGIQILSSGNNISAHQTGEAVDYGLVSNKAANIQKMLEYVRSNDFAEINPIDESKNKAGPHIHITVKSITSKGLEFIDQGF